METSNDVSLVFCIRKIDCRDFIRREKTDVFANKDLFLCVLIEFLFRSVTFFEYQVAIS